MSIPFHSRLGPYEITATIGSGGMGEVYVARDVRLGRIVAAKVISESLSADPAARDRFQREVRAASALNHPNICTVYDVGEWQGRPYLAMEYVDGIPLAKYLRHAPLPVDDWIDLASQLASALAAAHSKGIVHRDIKPGNIMLTADRKPKIMDFGLAKHGVESAGDALTQPASSAETRITRPGIPIGTAAYMSPEQARAEEVDRRTDLFSLGLVLYEAATGRRAFAGDSVASVLADLLACEPTPPSKINPSLPRHLDYILMKAIEKDRDLRYQHASEMEADLKRLRRELTEQAQTASRGRARLFRRTLAAASVLAIAAALILTFVDSRRGRNAVRLEPRPITANSRENPIIQSVLSRDGQMVAYADEFGLYLTFLATGETRSIPRPNGISRADSWWPVDWFPDGSQLLINCAKATPEGLRLFGWVVSARSAQAFRICESCLPYAVSPDGASIAFTAGGVSLAEELWVMDRSGAKARRIESTSARNTRFSNVGWSPDGQRLCYRKETLWLANDQDMVESITLDGSKPVVVAADAHHWGDFRWLSKGRILFSAPKPGAPEEDMNFWVLRVNSKTGAPAGVPRPVTDWTGFRIENFSTSADGSRLAFDELRQQTDVFLGQLAGGTLARPRRFTLDDDNDYPFFWSGDSKSIFFSSNHQGEYKLYRRNVNEDQAEPVLTSTHAIDPVRISPDGSWLLYIHREYGLGRLMIAPISNGIGRPYGYPGQVGNVSCATRPATNCLLGDYDAARQRLVFISFDPPDPTFRKSFEIAPDRRQEMHWTISPNGKELAMTQNHIEDAEIDVYSVSGSLERQVRVKGYNHLTSIDWAADGHSWFVSASVPTGCSLVRVYGDGNSRVMVTMRGRKMRTWSIPSPNGKLLAYLGWTITRNVSVIDRSPPGLQERLTLRAEQTSGRVLRRGGQAKTQPPDL